MCKCSGNPTAYPQEMGTQTPVSAADVATRRAFVVAVRPSFWREVAVLVVAGLALSIIVKAVRK